MNRIAIVAVSLLAAIGSAVALSSPAGAKAISKKAAGRQYLALVNPANAAGDKFSASAAEWTSSTTDAQAETAAKPFIASLKKLDKGLIDDRWPTGAKSDIRALVTADAPVIGDLQGLSSINLLSSSSWTTTFERDANSLSAAVAFVRHDLGLPAAK